MVGARHEDTGKSGAGMVYVFTRSGGRWTEREKLQGSVRYSSGYFGRAVAVDRDVLLVGADGADSGTGAAYFFSVPKGVCNNAARNSCFAGTADDSAVADDVGVGATARYKWRCGGAGFVGSAVCSVLKSAVQAGVCDNTVRNGCSVGSVNVASRTVSGTNWNWKCDGAAGGAISAATCSVARADVRSVPVAEEDDVQASDKAASDEFGYAVAIDGDTAVVGARYEDHDASGSNNKSSAGSAYVFTRNGSGVWSQQAKIVASDRETDDRFGWSVGISGDTVVVGAPYEDHSASGGGTAVSAAGSAYIFTRSGSVWSEQAKLVAGDRRADDYFGWSVDVDRDTVIVGAHYQDYDASDGNNKSKAGSAYVFTRTGEVWNQQQKIVASDRAGDDEFGYAVAIDGDTAVVGARYEDHDADGNNSKGNAGSAYVFVRSSSGVWSQQEKIVASDRRGSEYFGSAVDVEGDTAIVGAYYQSYDAADKNSKSYAGAAYVFTRSGTDWSQQQKLVASDRASSDHFGYSVAVEGDTAVVGAYLEDNGVSGHEGEAGSVYVFTRTGTVWMQKNKLTASDRDGGDNLGWSVGLSEGTAVMGAPYEDTGGSSAGKAYFFIAEEGVCDNTVRNSCRGGVANDSAVADETDKYKWRCEGLPGAGDSGVCSILKSKVKVGVCDNTVRFGCSTGVVDQSSRADFRDGLDGD